MTWKRMCRKGLHDLSDPANVYRTPSRPSDARCRPCRLAYQAASDAERRAAAEREKER